MPVQQLLRSGMNMSLESIPNSTHSEYVWKHSLFSSCNEGDFVLSFTVRFNYRTRQE